MRFVVMGGVIVLVGGWLLMEAGLIGNPMRPPPDEVEEAVVREHPFYEKVSCVDIGRGPPDWYAYECDLLVEGERSTGCWYVTGREENDEIQLQSVRCEDAKLGERP